MSRNMSIRILFHLAALLCAVTVSQAIADFKNLKLAGVVPNVVDVAPHHLIRVKYPSGDEVMLGNRIGVLKTSTQPSYSYKANQRKLYTIIMIDPDVISPELPILSPILHHMIVNIPGNQIELGETVAGYWLTFPLIGTHRYTYLLYEQHKGPIDVRIPFYNLFRFDFKDFAKKHHLGRPIAINFMRQSVVNDMLPSLFANKRISA